MTPGRSGYIRLSRALITLDQLPEGMHAPRTQAHCAGRIDANGRWNGVVQAHLPTEQWMPTALSGVAMSDPAGTLVRRWLKRGWPGGADVYWRTRRRLYGAMRGRIGQEQSDRLELRRRRFERAYSTGAWTSTGESLSGDGSSLRATEHIRGALPGTLRDLEVRTLLDVPCGDWNWMSQLTLDIDKYVGGDIVPSVVDANRHRFGDERHEFRVIDLCVDPLPSADLLLCRDAWIHFSYEDIRRSIVNISRAHIEFLATTNFPETTANADLVTGKYWRHLNLEVAPFHFPPPMLSLPDNFNRPDQVLSIWRVSDLRHLSLAGRAEPLRPAKR